MASHLESGSGPGTVYVVFCMDTEGPCADPSNPELLATWGAVNGAMDKLFDRQFRSAIVDPAGGRFTIGWFFLTWTGFTTNPRGRDFGYHKLRDHYRARWGALIDEYGDEECWHYHQPAASGIGNEWGPDWRSSSEYDQIISRQLLDRAWFPVCYRSGGTIMSPESSRWVDAWFPFDYTNRAPLNVPGLVDWSPGVAQWVPYHPSPEDFRKPGPGRRRMLRCLDLVTNLYTCREADVVEAFSEAAAGRSQVLAVFDHDYRDIRPRIEEFHELIGTVSARFRDVPWRYSGPVDAVRQFSHTVVPTPPTITLEPSGSVVKIRSTPEVFQAIPWVAVRTADGGVFHDVSNIVTMRAGLWHWTPPATVPWTEVAVGVSTIDGAAAVAQMKRQ